MPDSVPEYYRHLAGEKGEGNNPERQPDPKSDSGDEETDSQNAPSDPTVYLTDAFRLLRPEGEWTDSSVYTITGRPIDGVPHDITVNIDDGVEADSVCDSAGQELALVSIFRPQKQHKQ